MDIRKSLQNAYAQAKPLAQQAYANAQQIKPALADAYSRCSQTEKNAVITAVVAAILLAIAVGGFGGFVALGLSLAVIGVALHYFKREAPPSEVEMQQQ